MQILLFNLAALVGSFAQGLTGFGSGTLTVTLLVMLYDFRQVVPVVAMLVMVPNLMLAWLTRRETDWRHGPVAAFAMASGVVIGGQLLAVLPVEVLRRALGCAILVYVALVLTRTPAPTEAPRDSPANYAALAACGVAAGLIVGAVGVAPIPLLAYVSLRYPKKIARAILTQAFVVGTFTQLVTYAHLGLLTPDLAWMAVLSMPGIVIGVLIGNRLHYRVDQKTFARGLALILLLPAARLVIG